MDDGPGEKRGMAESLRRLLDQRDEDRSERGSTTAVMVHDGNRHDVALVNLSSSGAMIGFDGVLVDGDMVDLHLLDHEVVTGQVRWAQDGRAGISFLAPLETAVEC